MSPPRRASVVTFRAHCRSPRRKEQSVPSLPDRRSMALLPTASRRPRWLILLLGLALLLAPNLMTLPAYAEDPGFFTIDKTVDGFTDGQQVERGDTFVYTVTISCSNIGSGGCTNAQL